MSNIDRQRVAAVRKLEGMGYTFAAGDWMHPANYAVARAACAAGRPCRCPDGQACELEDIADAVQAYEAMRWPGGRTDGGKG